MRSATRAWLDPAFGTEQTEPSGGREITPVVEPRTILGYVLIALIVGAIVSVIAVFHRRRVRQNHRSGRYRI